MAPRQRKPKRLEHFVKQSVLAVQKKRLQPVLVVEPKANRGFPAWANIGNRLTCNDSSFEWLVSDCFLGSNLSAMVEIQDRVALSYAGGQLWQIPPALVLVEEGQKYLKLQGSHHVLVKLLCGKDLDKVAGVKNPSFANSEKLQVLKDKVGEAAGKLLKREQPVVEGEEVFAAEPEKKKGKYMAKQLPKPSPVQVEIPLEEVEVKPTVTLLAFSTSTKVDLHVLMQEDNLKHVFDFVSKDLEECFTGSKRSYKAKKDKQA